MLQHLIVTLIFAVCLYFAARHVSRIISRPKKGEPKCSTCTETDCPLRQASKSSPCGCGCGETAAKGSKNNKIPENCKKSSI